MTINHLDNFWTLDNPTHFDALALKTFQFQYEKNSIYRAFCDLINCNPVDVVSAENIPHLPISFFKSKRVCCFDDPNASFFSSSITSGGQASKHFYQNLDDYRISFRKGFEYFYGPIEDYTILALLPSYLDREGSSLIYMADDLIRNSQYESGFYLNQWEELKEHLMGFERQERKTLLLGVSFGLLDFMDRYTFDLKNTIVMETGGMKGRRKELTREALHQKLSEGFGCSKIHSEYGMTELLSQAYSKGDGLFECPPWMRVTARENQDPFQKLPWGQSGRLNVMDLANRNTCAFVATEDLGIIHSDSQFEVLGRFDASEIRGCNLMVV